MEKSRFQVGDKTRVWKPRNAEHGLKGIVTSILTIEEYSESDYDKDRGPHAYDCLDGWKDEKNRSWFRGALPDAMVCSELHYQNYRERNNWRQ